MAGIGSRHLSFGIVHAEQRRSTVMTAPVSETVSGTDDFAEEWGAWHRGQEARLADPHGFLAITSLHWLTDEPARTEWSSASPREKSWSSTARRCAGAIRSGSFPSAAA